MASSAAYHLHGGRHFSCFLYMRLTLQRLADTPRCECLFHENHVCSLIQCAALTKSAEAGSVQAIVHRRVHKYHYESEHPRRVTSQRVR